MTAGSEFDWRPANQSELAAKRGRLALEAAAAGGHHLALFGRDTALRLAQRLHGLLPDLDDRTATEVAQTYRKARLRDPEAPVARRPPWQAARSTTSVQKLTGSPTGPGAAALAHGGLLFLDDAGELADLSLRALRTVLDAGHTQGFGSHGPGFPARFQLVLASRACPVSREHGAEPCDCTPSAVRHYRQLLAPLLDRVEMRVVLPAWTPAPAGADWLAGESTDTVAARVIQARAAAADRWARYGLATNAQAATTAVHTDLAKRWAAQVAALPARIDVQNLPYRELGQLWAVAWTLADLAGRDAPDDADLAKAISLHLAA